MGLKHFLAPLGAQTPSSQGKEVYDLKMPKTLGITKFKTYALRLLETGFFTLGAGCEACFRNKNPVSGPPCVQDYKFMPFELKVFLDLGFKPSVLDAHIPKKPGFLPNQPIATCVFSKKNPVSEPRCVQD